MERKDERLQVVYIAGPYTAPNIYQTVQNIRTAESCAVKYMRLGYAVICPHKNTGLLDGIFHEKNSDIWLTMDFELIRRSDIVVMLPGWEKSYGARKEHAFAQKIGKKIIYEGVHYGPGSTDFTQRV